MKCKLQENASSPKQVRPRRLTGSQKNGEGFPLEKILKSGVKNVVQYNRSLLEGS